MALPKKLDRHFDDINKTLREMESVAYQMDLSGFDAKLNSLFIQVTRELAAATTSVRGIYAAIVSHERELRANPDRLALPAQREISSLKYAAHKQVMSCLGLVDQLRGSIMAVRFDAAEKETRKRIKDAAALCDKLQKVATKLPTNILGIERSASFLLQDWE